jgi:hypothetical protein
MKDMKDILKHFNTTASWFGTPGITDEEVDKLVTEVFEKHDAEKNGKLSCEHGISSERPRARRGGVRGELPPTART